MEKAFSWHLHFNLLANNNNYNKQDCQMFLDDQHEQTSCWRNLLPGLLHLLRPTGDFGCDSQLILIKLRPPAMIALINQRGVIRACPDSVNDIVITQMQNVGQGINNLGLGWSERGTGWKFRLSCQARHHRHQQWQQRCSPNTKPVIILLIWYIILHINQ